MASTNSSSSEAPITRKEAEKEMAEELPVVEDPWLSRMFGMDAKYEILMPLTILYGSLAVGFTIYSLLHTDVTTYALYFAPGFALWTLLEYAFHRWNHVYPDWDVDNHVHHHRFPDDPVEFVFDLTQSVPMYFFFTGLFFYGCPSYAAGAAAGAGLAVCYTLYEYVHLWGHLPQDGLYQWQVDWCSNHVRHHFGHPRKDYGFTTAFWDHVFGTYGDDNWRFKGDKRTVVFKDNQDNRWAYKGTVAEGRALLAAQEAEEKKKAK